MIMGEQYPVHTCRYRTHSSMRALVAVVLLLASCVGPALSFPTGAPREACTTATPNHPPATPQNTTNPYSIDLSVFDDGSGSFTYLPGRTYECEFSKQHDYNISQLSSQMKQLILVVSAENHMMLISGLKTDHCFRLLWWLCEHGWAVDFSLPHPVTLSAPGNSPTFKGFFIQGRLAADDSTVGTFVEPAAGSGTRLSSCVPPNVCCKQRIPQ